MKRLPNPCYKCSKRSRGGDTCHAKCPRYKMWAYGEKLFKEEMDRQKKENSDYLDYMASASARISHSGRKRKEE